jgi:hypothetical protein
MKWAPYRPKTSFNFGEKLEIHPIPIEVASNLWLLLYLNQEQESNIKDTTQYYSELTHFIEEK